MSKIGSKVIVLEKGVTAILKDGRCYLESSKGKLDYPIDTGLECKIEDNKISLELKSGSKHSKAMWGTTRALLANAAVGLYKPWVKTLELKGIGYKVKLNGKTLNLSIGYTPFDHVVPADVEVTCPVPTQIVLSGIDKERIGLVASQIRAHKEPDAYKGYGIRYLGENIKLKAVSKK